MAGPSVVLLLLAAVALLVGAGEARSAWVDAASAFRSRATDPVKFDFTPFLIQYRSGRVQRLMGTSVVPATTLDPRTGVASRDVVVDHATGLAARIYLPPAGPRRHHPHGGGAGKRPRLPVLLYFHGGAFVVESAFGPAYHHYLNALAARAGVVAVSVNYRLAPEHPLPAAYDDSWAALRWVLANARRGGDPWLSRRADASRLFLAGDSAGGNIAHNLAMRAGQQLHLDAGPSTIRGVALLDPYFLGGRYVGPTAARSWGFICAGRYGPDHPYVNPTALPASAWRRVPTSRVLVTVSGNDGLGPWQRAYVDAVRGSGWGGEARLYVTPGEGHCFFLNDLDSPKAAMHMATLAAFVNGS
jgi:acetyl esterase/lipase